MRAVRTDRRSRVPGVEATSNIVRYVLRSMAAIAGFNLVRARIMSGIPLC